MVEKTVRLLLTAGILLMISGCIFGFIGQWIYAALVWAGAFGCYTFCVSVIGKTILAHCYNYWWKQHFA